MFIAADNGSDGSLEGRANGRLVKGGIYQMTENGANVGCIVAGSKLVPGGRVGSMIDFSDIFPTFCEFAGVPVPKGLNIDGRSYAKYLRGEAGVPRTWIYNQYRPDRVVRDERFKLWSNGKFYDLEADPAELKPLPAGANAAADAARQRLQAVLASMPADTPLPYPHRSLSAFKQRRAGMK